jgi:ADP-ribosylglycohydrolase
MMSIPDDYAERVYAGVLGKIIGVYLGRPFEGWTYQRIMEELGEVRCYVHDRLNKPLIVPDDDISGTFTFLRALADYGHSRDLTPAQIGQTWLNYIIEGRTILWWGGLGNSTEHTAYLRLKSGIAAPRSGSRLLNGTIVSEQIGAQIFIDGWAMVAPGDPELAAELARRAASVSHDGEAIYGAQVLAAMEALAFSEPDLARLLDVATSLIPRDSVISRMIADVRAWHAAEEDWRVARERLATGYGYDRYGGNCHIVPNHGLIVLSLLYGGDSFQKSLMIVNTCGWDTDCNSGNVGCLLGIKNGLAGIESDPDWRGPVADRLYLPTADGGRAITDAATETYHIVNMGRALAAEDPVVPKSGARFHFELPGSVQGFRPDMQTASAALMTVENVRGHSRRGTRSLALHYQRLGSGRVARVSAATFIPPEALQVPGYGLLASPTLYSGQMVRVGLMADENNPAPVSCSLFFRAYGAGDRLYRSSGPEIRLKPGDWHELEWRVADSAGAPIAEIGLELSADRRAHGVVYLDYLTWEGAPDVLLTRPPTGGTLWRRAWVDGMDQFEARWPEAFRIVQNRGTGLLIQGTREWTDYRISAAVSPHLVKAGGIAARVQGMQRYYALLLCDDRSVRLVKALDGETVLAERAFDWSLGAQCELSLSVVGRDLQASAGDRVVFEVSDADQPLMGGGVALVCTEGCLSCEGVRVAPAG